MPLVTLVIGLPASGKSTYVEQFVRDGIPVFDDLMRGSPPGDFSACRHIPRIESHLAAGRDVVLTDIRLTDARFHEGVVNHLRAVAPAVEFRNVCFANDPVSCLANSARRARNQVENHRRELELIAQLSGQYAIPPGAEVMPVNGNRR